MTAMQRRTVRKPRMADCGHQVEAGETIVGAWKYWTCSTCKGARTATAKPDLKEPASGTALMSEAEFSGAVFRLAIRNGLRCGPANTLGWPLVIIGPGGVRFRTLKERSSSLSLAERAWARSLRESGADWACWRPSDWRLIEVTLRHLSKP